MMKYYIIYNLPNMSLERDGNPIIHSIAFELTEEQFLTTTTLSRNPINFTLNYFYISPTLPGLESSNFFTETSKSWSKVTHMGQLPAALLNAIESSAALKGSIYLEMPGNIYLSYYHCSPDLVPPLSALCLRFRHERETVVAAPPVIHVHIQQQPTSYWNKYLLHSLAIGTAVTALYAIAGVIFFSLMLGGITMPPALLFVFAFEYTITKAGIISGIVMNAIASPILIAAAAWCTYSILKKPTYVPLRYSPHNAAIAPLRHLHAERNDDEDRTNRCLDWLGNFTHCCTDRRSEERLERVEVHGLREPPSP